MSFIEITTNNLQYLADFIKINTFPSTFRYFNNKTPDMIIKNHYKTLLYTIDDICVGYGHIDYDIINNKYWFGVCVIDSYHGKGIGKKLTTKLIEYYNTSNIDKLHLTVDKSNHIAYNMYIKSGFKVVRETNNIYVMCLYKSNILYLPVSFGEAIDKLTILDIKMNKIHDMRRKDVEKEYNTLFHILSDVINSIKVYYNILKVINLKIWEDQDKFRYSDDDEEKNIICKQIIRDNDARFRVKYKINNILNSNIKEQKGYKPINCNICTDVFDNKLITIVRFKSIIYDSVNIVCSEDIFNSIKAYFIDDLSITVTINANKGHVSNVDNLYNSIAKDELFKFIETI
jgi:hypothetical protein